MYSCATRVNLCLVFASSYCAIARGNIYRAGVAQFRQLPGYLWGALGVILASAECGVVGNYQSPASEVLVAKKSRMGNEKESATPFLITSTLPFTVLWGNY